MPTTDQYTFDPGIDYSLLFGGFATALTQGTQLQTPNAAHGMIAYTETQPLTSGQPSGYPTNWYSFNARGLWVKPSTGETYAYKTATGFINVATLIPANTITNAMVVAGTLDKSRFSVSGGVAGQVLIINAGGTAWEYGDAITNRLDNSIPVAKLTAGTNGQYLTTSGGITTWGTLTGTILNTIFTTGPRLGESLVNPGLPYQILRTDPTASFSEWANVGDVFAANTIPIDRLFVDTGNAGKIIKVNSGGTSFEFAPEPAPYPTTGAAMFVYSQPNATALGAVPASPATVPFNTTTHGASWATLGGSAVTITAGTYVIDAVVNLEDVPATFLDGRLQIKDGATIIAWHDFSLNGADGLRQFSVAAPLTVASTAILTVVVEYVGSAQYGAWIAGSSAEHIA